MLKSLSEFQKVYPYLKYTNQLYIKNEGFIAQIFAINARALTYETLGRGHFDDSFFALTHADHSLAKSLHALNYYHNR